MNGGILNPIIWLTILNATSGSEARPRLSLRATARVDVRLCCLSERVRWDLRRRHRRTCAWCPSGSATRALVARPRLGSKPTAGVYVHHCRLPHVVCGSLEVLFSMNYPGSPGAMVDLLVLLHAPVGARDVGACPHALGVHLTVGRVLSRHTLSASLFFLGLDLCDPVFIVMSWEKTFRSWKIWTRQKSMLEGSMQKKCQRQKRVINVHSLRRWNSKNVWKRSRSPRIHSEATRKE